jgi:23S rRNA pseudouridine1911/1915/1917 synthase
MGRQLSFDKFQKAIQRVISPLPGSVALPIYYKLPVKQKYNGYNILDFLAEVLPSVSEEIWLEKIKNRELLIEKESASCETIVLGGNIIEHQSEPQIEPDISVNIQLIYQDEDVLVLNKPAPLPMHPSGRFNKNTLSDILKLTFPSEEFKLIHRLDANTSGLVILPKNANTFTLVAHQFESKSVHKEY